MNILELTMHEMIMFVLAAVAYLIAAVAGVLQLRRAGRKYNRWLVPSVSVGLCLEATMLIFRALILKAFPLSSLFDSMIVLTAAFALLFLFINPALRQVWFASVMVWVIFVMMLMAGAVAKPITEPHEIATIPWAVMHGISMIISGASVALATVTALLYLLSRRRLKQKDIMKLIGKVPSIEKLKTLNASCLKICFATMTFGLMTGAGLAVAASGEIQIGFIDWLKDAKIVLMTAAWLLIAVVLILRRAVGIKGKTVAYTTLLIFFLILFGIVGVTFFCGTKHDFTKSDVEQIETMEQTYP